MHYVSSHVFSRGSMQIEFPCTKRIACRNFDFILRVFTARTVRMCFHVIPAKTYRQLFGVCAERSILKPCLVSQYQDAASDSIVNARESTKSRLLWSTHLSFWHLISSKNICAVQKCDPWNTWGVQPLSTPHTSRTKNSHRLHQYEVHCRPYPLVSDMMTSNKCRHTHKEFLW